MRFPFVSILAIVSICVIEIFALAHGINGTALAASVGAIAAIAGYQFGKKNTLAPECKFSREEEK